jgi:hypothetical protein
MAQTFVVYPFFFQGFKLRAQIFSDSLALILVLVFLDEFFKATKNLESEEKTMEENIKNCMFEEQCGTHMVKISICWASFCVNDNKDVDVKCRQTIFFVTIVQFCFITLKFKQKNV